MRRKQRSVDIVPQKYYGKKAAASQRSPFLTHLGVLLVLLAAPPLAAPARAWGSFTPLQTVPLVSDVSCAAEAANIAVCAAVGPASKLLINRFNGTAWTGWVKFQVVTSAPSCSNAGTRTVI